MWVRRAWMPGPVILAAFGVLLLGIGAIVAWQGERVPDGWVLTTATVTKVIPPQPNCFRRCTTSYVIEAPGTDSHLTKGDHELGDRVRIAYDPAGHRWKEMGVSAVVLWGLFVGGAVCLIGAVLVAVLTAPRVRYPLRGARRITA